MTQNEDAVRANSTIAVNALKLSRGLKTTFEGIAQVFDSLGAETEFQESLSLAHAAPREQPPEPQGTQPKEPVALPEPAASSLTIDDITKVIVSKIKQDRSNNEKIEKLVQSFGVQSVKAIPPERFEAFMTELAAI